ncbi:MAG: hypothetical protein CMJ78_17485 [Planctomycetaceae bacterium]|nr:hypothetical protein [Planctomycetaceae bacterium]
MLMTKAYQFTGVLVALTCFSVSFADDSVQLIDPNKSNDSQAEEVDPLLTLVDKAIDTTSKRYLTAGRHTPWQIMHGILALRDRFEVRMDGKKTSALKWIQDVPNFRGKPLVLKTNTGGQFHPYTQPYDFQGHPCQFLAILTMSQLPMDFEFRTENGKLTLADVVETAKANINDQEEITWALWALSHFVGPDADWTNKNGEAWSVERLVKLQIEDEPTEAACGGTHGLFALAYARNGYIHTERPLRGVWLEADMKIRRYVEMAKSLQNSDGSFSSNHFGGPGYTQDFSDRLAAAGHTMEFLMMALPQPKLNEDWVRRGVEQVANDLIENRNVPVKCGPLYHGLHGLVIYKERMQPVNVTLDSNIEPAETDVAETTEPVEAETVTEELPEEEPAEEVVADDASEEAETDEVAERPAETTEEPVQRTAEKISDQAEL